MLIQKNKHPKLIIISSMIMLALMTLGCQHSPIHFTEAQAPNIPSFDVPKTTPLLVIRQPIYPSYWPLLNKHNLKL